MLNIKKTATIYDVARVAGVSVATVSRVFSDSILVKKDTVEKIKLVAAELDYYPSSIARGLSVSRNKTIGFILPVVYGEFFSELLYNAETEIQKRKHHLLISSVHNSIDELREAIRSLRGKVDAIAIFFPYRIDEKILGKMTERIPVVFLSDFTSKKIANVVTIDNFDGSKKLTEVIIKMGHKKIAYFRAEQNNIDAYERYNGFLKAIEDYTNSEYEVRVFDAGFTRASGRATTAQLLNSGFSPSVIICANDACAIGTFRSLREHNIDVPNQISLAGFDDIETASLLYPQLSTVSVNIRELAVTAVVRLFEMLDSPETMTHLDFKVITAELKIRDSVRQLL